MWKWRQCGHLWHRKTLTRGSCFLDLSLKNSLLILKLKDLIHKHLFHVTSRGALRPQEVHANQGLKVGLYTPTILGGNSYLCWFYDRGAIKDPAHIETSKGLSQATNRGPIRKFLPKYANVYVTIQSHGLSKGAQTHYVIANGVRNGLVVLCDLFKLKPGCWNLSRPDKKWHLGFQLVIV